LNYTCNVSRNQDQLIGKALKVLGSLTTNIKKMRLRPKLLCQLFDAFIGSIINYGTWGFGRCEGIERVHLNNFKYVLKVRKSTSSVGV